jgi:hypothetical protein
VVARIVAEHQGENHPGRLDSIWAAFVTARHAVSKYPRTDVWEAYMSFTIKAGETVAVTQNLAGDEIGDIKAGATLEVTMHGGALACAGRRDCKSSARAPPQ